LPDRDEVVWRVVRLGADGTLVLDVVLLDEGVPGTLVAHGTSTGWHHDSVLEDILTNWTF
jgi:hypothetical protein